MTIINLLLATISFFCTTWWDSVNDYCCDEYESVNFVWWDFACCNEYWDELLRKYVDNVFCIVSRNVRCDLRNAIQICLLLKLSVTIRSRDHAWSFHRQFFWLFNLVLTNEACLSSIIEWRMLVLDSSSDVYDETSLNLTRHLIKLIVSDSSNLTKVTHQTWWVKTSSHQIWRRRLIKLDEWKRHLIKSDSSNLMTSSHQIFEKRDSFFIFWWVVFCSDTWYEELSLAENHHFVRR
jgi:hypothetical protein